MTLENTLELLAKQEESLAALYRTYAHQFPEYEDFWLKIAQQEIGHAAMVRKMQQLQKDGKLTSGERQFSPEQIQTALGHYEKERLRAQRGITLTQAFSVAMGIESSMLEKEFFLTFAGDSPQAQKAFTFLREETAQHKKLLEEAYDKALQRRT